MTHNEFAEQRQVALQQWFYSLNSEFSDQSLSPISGDASFRRYFRGRLSDQNFILVDAPPEQENNQAFVAIAEKFIGCGVNVPQVFGVDYQRGFMCLSDLGTTQLWEVLDSAKQNGFIQSAPESTCSVTELYRLAYTQLLKIQSCEFNQQEATGYSLPQYDEAMLLREMQLFTEWFCEGLLGLHFAEGINEKIQASFRILIDSALAQPQVCVHRDYHSRNLLYRDGQALGVIDFQDAVLGPISYDLVSLLKDCYICWPRQQVNAWALEYAALAQQKDIIERYDEALFLRDFDLMGVQRHLKAIGIFSRLYLRDKKPGYLIDIPRTLGLIREVLVNIEALQPLAQYIEDAIVPIVNERIEAVTKQERAV